VLSPLKKRDWHLCSFHPCYSFSKDSVFVAKDVCFAVEGDEAGCQRLENMADAIGGRYFRISMEFKTRYHTACVIASNYVVTLLSLAERLMAGSGEDLQCLLPMARDSVMHVAESGAQDALTGPILRGDIQTVEAHLKALSETDVEVLRIYIALGRATLGLARDAGLTSETTDAFESLFHKFQTH
jgi:predicted short-subunit dehydrogenase-like oxidoreductase (DUF2520 family)